MKHTKTTLISLVLCLFIISNILALNSNKKTTERINENPKDKKSSFITFSTNTNLEEKLESKLNTFTDASLIRTNSEKGNKGKPKKTKYVKAVNNVYLNTINFYLRILRTFNDYRSQQIIASEISMKCPKLNIFDTIREDLINCKTLQRKLNERNRNIIKYFRTGCMKTILTNIRDKCSVIKNSEADSFFSGAIEVLNNMTKEQQRRLRYQGNKFVKRMSFSLKVFKKLVDERAAILKKVELKRLKAEAKKKGKGKKKFFLEMNSKLLLKKGNKKKKTAPKNSLGIIKLAFNNSYDKKFIKDTNLTPEKSINIANVIIRAIDKINSV